MTYTRDSPLIACNNAKYLGPRSRDAAVHGHGHGHGHGKVPTVAMFLRSVWVSSRRRRGEAGSVINPDLAWSGVAACV